MIKRKIASAVILPCLILVGSLSVVSCASTPKEEPSTESTGAVSIAVPKKKNNSYFFSIKDELISLAEEGSPTSIRTFVSKIHKPLKEDYTENERVLLEISSTIMSMVWPSESFATDYCVVDFYNPYTPIINSVKCGLFDESAEISDYFTSLLPCLLILTTDMKDSYLEPMKSLLNKCLTEKSDSMVANYLMALVQLRFGKPKSALEYLKVAGSQKSKPKEIARAKSKAYFLCGNYEKALELSKKVLEKVPEDKVSLEIACRSLVELEQWEESMNYSIKILQLEPENIDYLLLRAKILIATGDYLKASTLLDSCQRIDATNRDYFLLRGWMQKNWSKNTSAVVETMTSAVKLYPNDKEVLLFSAQVASGSGNKIGGLSAIDLVTKVFALDNDNVEAMDIYIKEMLKSGQYENAYNMSLRLLEFEKTDDALCDYVESCLSLSKNEEAMAISSQLYESNPDSEKAQQIYIKTLVASNQTKEAQELISILMENASTSMKSFLYYEKSLTDSKSEEILSDLRASLSFNARNVDALYSMYKIYYGEKNWKMAQFYLKQVLSLKPDDISIQKKMAELENYINK